MSLMRYLKSDLVKLRLDTRQDPELAEDPVTGKKYLRELKEKVLDEISVLFETSGNISNKSKLLTDLSNREKKASTALGAGVAVPHVRTMQARQMTIAFLRSPEGIYFDAPDGKPVHVFFAMVAPPYEDQEYLKLYKAVATMFSAPSIAAELISADSEGQIRGILRRYF